MADKFNIPLFFMVRMEKLNTETLQWYKTPPMEQIVKKGLKVHWFSYYEKWTPQENYYYAEKLQCLGKIDDQWKLKKEGGFINDYPGN